MKSPVKWIQVSKKKLLIKKIYIVFIDCKMKGLKIPAGKVDQFFFSQIGCPETSVEHLKPILNKSLILLNSFDYTKTLASVVDSTNDPAAIQVIG